MSNPSKQKGNPVNIFYTTSEGKKMIVGSGKVDLYISKKDD